MVLLFQYPVAVAWTFAPSQSIECWNFCVCTAILFLGSSQHTCFSSVCELAVMAGHFIHNISFLLHWGLLLHSHHYAPQCLLGLGLTHQNKHLHKRRACKRQSKASSCLFEAATDYQSPGVRISKCSYRDGVACIIYSWVRYLCNINYNTVHTVQNISLRREESMKRGSSKPIMAPLLRSYSPPALVWAPLQKWQYQFNSKCTVAQFATSKSQYSRYTRKDTK